MATLISIIIPAYCEENNLPVLYSSMTSSLPEDMEWEFLFIDDGSTDGTFRVLADIACADPRVRAIGLSRNFGSHIAISAGLDVARGDAAILLSADMQEPLDVIPEMIRKWREGSDVVWGVRRSRQDPVFSRWTSRALNRLFGLAKALAGYPSNASSFVLLDRKVVHALTSFSERNRLITRLVAWAGFRSAEIPCDFKPRHSGRSRWTLARKIKTAVDLFTAFSYLPIRIVSLLGILVSLASFAYAVGIVSAALARGVAVQGWPTLMAVVLFLGGLQLLVSGMLGEYIWRALDESRRRPLYFILQTAGFCETETARLVGAARGGRDCEPVEHLAGPGGRL
jgi:polyisoprenyl-phosphate glycosyltransferase